jgi:hypothetical protein
MKNKIKDFKERCNEIRSEIFDAIVSLMNKHNTKVVSCDLSDTPIIIYDSYCDDNIHTLDDIILCDNDNIIKFGCSSCFSNTYAYINDLDIELLIDVFEWVIENEDEIFDED